MQEEDTKLHIVEVNDGVIDLRKEMFDKDPDPLPSVKSVTTQLPPYRKLYGSEPALQKAKWKKRVPIPRDLQKNKASDVGVRFVNACDRRSRTNMNESLKKCAETLYNAPISYSSVSSSTATAVSKSLQAPNVMRNKPILRTKKPNTRVAAMDPRFRRARSPSSKNPTLVTQSESKVSPTTSERRKSKSQSDSKFLLNSQVSDKISTPRVPIGELGDSAPSTKKSPTHKSGYTNIKVGNNSNEENSISKTVDNKDKVKSTDDTTITNSSSAVGASLYQSAVCGDVMPRKETDKPFWDDPRLIDKYGKVLKPVSIAPRNSLSSWTIPIQKSSRCHNDSFSSNCRRCMLARSDSQTKKLFKRTCSKCICTYDNDTMYTEVSTKTVMDYKGSKEKSSLSINRSSNYLLALFFAIGSICGLLLVTLVVWVIANDLMWAYAQKNVVPRFTGMPSWLAYLCGGLIYSIKYCFRMVGYLFVLPRNEVYDWGTKVEEPAEPWYTSLISWTGYNNM